MVDDDLDSDGMLEQDNDTDNSLAISQTTKKYLDQHNDKENSVKAKRGRPRKQKSVKTTHKKSTKSNSVTLESNTTYGLSIDLYQ